MTTVQQSPERQRYSLREIDAMARAEFVANLGGIYEHSPWVAEDAWSQHPFATLANLSGAMARAVREAPRDRQLALICAHPRLERRASKRSGLTGDSRREQAGAGIAACTHAQADELEKLNDAYAEKFGFPFILAVRGRGVAEILANLRARLGHSADTEFVAALVQIDRIANLRLAERIDEDAP